jgi:tight adherence protein B
MPEGLVLVLVFVAVTVFVWVVTPLLAQIGIERSVGKYMKAGGDNTNNVIYRFTTPERLIQSCWLGALMGAGLTGAALVGFSVLNPYIVGGACLGAGLLSYQIPRLWLNQRIRRRNQAFEARLVDLTLGLANGLRSGAALPQSIELVSRDLGGPMTEEFNLVLHEYRLGIDLPESLSRLAERMPGEDLSLLVTAVRLTMQSGGSLAEVLEKITDTIRHRTEFQQRLRTMTEQGRFEAIAMAFSPLLTFAILYYLDPDLMRPMVTTSLGWCAIGAVLLMETIGFFIINKIVTIKV